MVVTANLGLWKEKLTRTKKHIKTLLEEAKQNGGKNETIRRRLKQELKIAKDLKRNIKEIEGFALETLHCPCCKCVCRIEDSESGQTLVLVQERPK